MCSAACTTNCRAICPSTSHVASWCSPGTIVVSRRSCPSFTQALDHPCRPTTLLIIAGGRFHLSSRQRVRGAASALLPATSLERRRSRSARTSRLAIVRTSSACTCGRRTGRCPPHGLARSATPSANWPTRTGISSVFVAADTPEGRVQWLAELELLGLSGWSAPEPNLDRSTAGAGVDAMVDWRVLSRSRGIVYSRASSFGEEAAVAADVVEVSTPLSASDGLQRTRRAAALGRALMTYPRRRLAQGRNPS